ncbi:MAG: AbrB/MazE/SpoVT family DNA-binding domain-containing protein [Deltaproteobacteria bacterium]|nr:AbrB/MazE/SpoVT family DNA-binding domain-containing protein [Deltaproteobacteria bacterium]
MTRAVLSTKGQVVLPHAIRDALGLTPGSEFEVTTEGDAVILRPLSRFKRVALEDAVGCIPYSGPARSVEEMHAGIAEMFRARAKRP